MYRCHGADGSRPTRVYQSRRRGRARLSDRCAGVFSTSLRSTATQTITSVSLSFRGQRWRCETSRLATRHRSWKRLALRLRDGGISRPPPLRRILSQSQTLFSIHNLAYQGAFDPNDLWWLGFGESPEKDDFMLKSTASALKAGLIAADALSTVSRRYSQEIQTPEHGAGLDWFLRARRDRLAGITNGVDYELWNPETDPHIAAQFFVPQICRANASANLICCARFGLPEDPDRPIIAIISRLVSQKGYDLIRQACRSHSGNRRFLHRTRRGREGVRRFSATLARQRTASGGNLQRLRG